MRLTFVSILSLFVLLAGLSPLAGCGAGEKPAGSGALTERELTPPPVDPGSTVPDPCPWGVGACSWPTTEVPGALTAESLATTRREVGVSFSMQGTGYLAAVTLRAVRLPGSSSDGSLVIELRKDAPSPKVGTLFAVGRIAAATVCEQGAPACTTDAQVHTIALNVLPAVPALSNRTAYWMRIFADSPAPLSFGLASADAAVSTDVRSSLRTVVGTGTGKNPTAQAAALKYAAPAPDVDLAFLPRFVGRAPVGCRDGLRNGEESDVDCGTACGIACAEGKFCGSGADCGPGRRCVPLRGGFDDSVCGSELCACKAALKDGSPCTQSADCKSGRCSTDPTQSRLCEPSSCGDGLRSTKESDVDCGGSCVAGCGVSQLCGANADCADGLYCKAGSCVPRLPEGGACDADDICDTGLCLKGSAPVVCGLPLPTGSLCQRPVECGSGSCKSKRCAAVTAIDRIRNGVETDVDCGGEGNPPCAFKKACSIDADCATGTVCSASSVCLRPAAVTCAAAADCASGICAGTPKTCRAASACTDGVRAGSESDVDCGGSCVVDAQRRCAVGKKCAAHADCVTGICSAAGVCQAPSCTDRVRNGAEAGVDCGGSCGKCPAGTLVSLAADCLSGVRRDDGSCAPPACDDGVLNGDETGRDADAGTECGGKNCRPCPRSAVCKVATDCRLGTCPKTKVCTPPAAQPAGKSCEVSGDCATGLSCTCGQSSCAQGEVGLCASTALCSDNVKNNGESDVDCGGTLCGRACAVGKKCLRPSDCGSGVCKTGLCAAPASTDGVRNGSETAVDCGGGPAPACALGKACVLDADCASGECDAARDICVPSVGACGNVADSACGRSCGACAGGQSCRADADCASWSCVSGQCAATHCVIDGQPRVPGAVDPVNACSMCDVRNPAQWTARASGSVCPGGVCGAGGFCVPMCGNAPCPAAPQVDSVQPAVVHVELDTSVVLSGQRLGGPVEVTLTQGDLRVVPTGVLSSDSALRFTIPAGMTPGLWTVDLASAGGSTRVSAAVRVVNDPLRIDVLSVGQGDASLLRSPAGRTLLIDGSIFGMGTSRVVPRLPAPPDWVLVSHFDADHLAGVYEVLAGPDQLPNTADDVDPVVTLLDHGVDGLCTSQLCQRYILIRDRLAAQGKARAAVPGEWLLLGGGVEAQVVFSHGVLADGTVVSTSEENENNVGLLVEFGGFRYYTGGDATAGRVPGCSAASSSGIADIEGPASRLLASVDALKASHHGSCTSTPLALSAAAAPQVALVSMGLDNSYCHPSSRVLSNLANVGADLLLTNPGMVNPANNAGCALTMRPASTAPVFGNLSLTVPGDGTFGATVFDGSNTWSRTYTVRDPQARAADDVTNWPVPAELSWVGDRAAQPVAGPLVLSTTQSIVPSSAWLVPWALVDDAWVRSLQAGQTPVGAVPASVSATTTELRFVPATPLAQRSEWALVVPRSAAMTRTLVLPFRTGWDTTEGPRPTLIQPPALMGLVSLNVPSVRVTFDRPVTGLSDASVFLEEESSSADLVRGTVVPDADGRGGMLQLAPASRVGPGGAACSSLCPGLTYALRVTSAVHDAQGRPVVDDDIDTVSTGSCMDGTSPSIQSPSSQGFAMALSVTFQADEPVAGQVLVAPAGQLSACAASPALCRTGTVQVGSCTTNACSPITGSCAYYAVIEGLIPGTAYEYEVRVVDGVGRAANVLSGTQTAIQSDALVVTEVLADSPSSPEEQGEFIEVMNVGADVVDLCTFRLGRTAAEQRVLCTTPASILLDPGATALLVGGGFCDGSSCASVWTATSSTPLARTSTVKLFSTGVANDPLPTVLLQGAGTVLSSVTGGGRCAEGQSRTRLSPYAPDVAGAFACRPASPGLVE